MSPDITRAVGGRMPALALRAPGGRGERGGAVGLGGLDDGGKRPVRDEHGVHLIVVVVVPVALRTT